jgi:hypothetical protein
MKIKEFDGIKTKDGFEGTVLEIYPNASETAYLIEGDVADDEGIYPQRTVKKSEIEKVTFVASK